jgi:hypothetical protein
MVESDEISTTSLLIKTINEHQIIIQKIVEHLDSSVDKMDLQRIAHKNEPKKEPNVTFTLLSDEIKVLEGHLESYKKKLIELETTIKILKNNGNSNSN